MPSNENCDIGKLGGSVSCSNKTQIYESLSEKCSISTCNIKSVHEHRLCDDCGKLFNQQKIILEKR